MDNRVANMGNNNVANMDNRVANRGNNNVANMDNNNFVNTSSDHDPKTLQQSVKKIDKPTIIDLNHGSKTLQPVKKIDNTMSIDKILLIETGNTDNSLADFMKYFPKSTPNDQVNSGTSK